MLVEALLDNGQSILVSKLFDDPNYSDKTNETSTNETETLLQLAKDKLKPKTLEKLKEYLTKQKSYQKDSLK